jgi:tRNA(Ile)-lysidine synthase
VFERIEATLSELGIRPGSERSILVGYSGGADSTFLLHCLHTAGYNVCAAHLHHGQRPEADQEMRLCEAFCQELGVPFLSGRADVPALAKAAGIGLEEAGRKLRYQFLEQAARALQCEWIATAHTLDDQAETVLHNLARGAGIQGAAGIPAVRGNIIRPILHVSREWTRGYCQSRHLWFHDDPANEDLRFSRARIRHRVLPELSQVNARAARHIAEFAALMAEEDAFLDRAAASGLEHAELPRHPELGFLSEAVECGFYAEILRSLPPVLARRGLRLAVRSMGGALDRNQCETAWEGILAGGKGSVSPAGTSLALSWSPDEVWVRDLQPVEPFRFPLTAPGETASDVFGWRFEVWPAQGPAENPVRAALETELCAKGNLFFRAIEPGDEMQPLGFPHRRKVSDLAAEAGLSKAVRNRLPLVCDLAGPVWIPGVCLAERARRVSGEPGWRIRFGPIS